jgi:hypothetical protein
MRKKLLQFWVASCIESCNDSKDVTLDEIYDVISSIIPCSKEELVEPLELVKAEETKYAYKGTEIKGPTGYKVVFAYFDVYGYDPDYSFIQHWAEFERLLSRMNLGDNVQIIEKNFRERYEECVLDSKLRVK